MLRNNDPINKRQTIRRVIAMACVAGLICAPVAPMQAQSTPSPTPSPGGGITNGLNPIETTLFAYRSLASDVEAVSREVAVVANGKKVVIGTPADVAAFTQWRAVMGQILLLDERASRISGETRLAQYEQARQLPAAALSVGIRHYPIQADATKKATLRITVKNGSGPSAGPTNAAVTVTANLPDDWKPAQPTGDGWTCSATGVSCSRSDTLQPGQSYSDILVAVTLPATPDPAKQIFSITVSGGGSATSSTYDMLKRPVLIPQKQEVGAGSFRVTVYNADVPDAGSTNGPVTVQVRLPSGRKLVASPNNPTGISGDGWDHCNPDALRCERSDPLGPGKSYPSILVTTDEADNIDVTVSGGGSEQPAAAEAKALAPAEPEAIAPQGVPAPAGGGAFSAITGAIPTFISLGQFLATALAVTQTLAPSQLTISDLPLMNMVARQLKHDGVPTILIPYVYTPNLLRNGNLNDTYLWKALSRLEEDRRQMWVDVANASGKLGQANFVVQNPTRYSQEDLNKALKYSAKIQSLISSALAVATSIDTFEASLFGGSAPAQPQQTSQSPAQNQSPNTTPAPTQNPAAAQTSTPAPTAAPAQPQPQTPQPPSAQPTSPQAPSSPSPSGGAAASLLPQILASDLLAHALCDGPDGCWDPLDLHASKFNFALTGINFLAVHAQEAGGTQLNKSNTFYGTHIFFSGGAVMTFALYQVTGEVSCSGVAYNYEGNAREKHYDRALRLPQLPAIINTDFACDVPRRHPHTFVSRAVPGEISVGMTMEQLQTAFPSGPNRTSRAGHKLALEYEDFTAVVENGTVTAVTGPAIRIGMTTHQVLAADPAPYRTLKVKGNVYTYEFEDADHTKVVFRDGVVVKVMKKKKEAK